MRQFKKTTTLLLTTALLLAGRAILDINAEGSEAITVNSTQIERVQVIRTKEPEPTITAARITQEPTTTLTPAPTSEPTARIYDIPLTKELQEYTFNLCQENNLDYEFTLAVMDQESDYQEKAISKTNDYGIMQINKINHEWLSEKLGIDDFLDAEQNILAGVKMLSDLITKYEDPHKALMAYNAGEAGAKKHWDKGTTTSGYSREVMARTEELKEEGKQ